MGTKKALLAVLMLAAAACGGEVAAGSPSTQPGDTAAPAEDGTASAEPPGTSTETSTESPGTSGQTSADAGQTSSDLGSCTITVTGDIELTETFEQDVYSFTSDYWFTEEEESATFEFLQEEGSTQTYEDFVASGMPVVTWFAFSCGEDAGVTPSVLAYPTDTTTRDQLPMGPGTYPVSGSTLGDADGPPGTYITNLFVEENVVFRPIPDSGDLVIEVWDQSRITGTMTFDAVEAELLGGGDREVSVTVEFDFLCNEFHSACQ